MLIQLKLYHWMIVCFDNYVIQIIKTLNVLFYTLKLCGFQKEIAWYAFKIYFKLYLNFYNHVINNFTMNSKKKTDGAYLVNTFVKLNKVNNNLLDDNISFIKSKSIINLFDSKWGIFKEKNSRPKCSHFSELSSSKQILKSHLEIYCTHLESL